jgi:hypothetical protein
MVTLSGLGKPFFETQTDHYHYQQQILIWKSGLKEEQLEGIAYPFTRPLDLMSGARFASDFHPSD